MPIKSKRPHLKDIESGFEKFFKNILSGKKPAVNEEYITTGIPSAVTKRNITININMLLENFEHIKIGKTGDSYIRTDKNDYRGNYKQMFLVYKSTSKKFVSELEAHYIQKYKASHPNNIDNISLYSGGKMTSYDGYYYLYVVCR